MPDRAADLSGGHPADVCMPLAALQPCTSRGRCSRQSVQLHCAVKQQQGLPGLCPAAAWPVAEPYNMPEPAALLQRCVGDPVATQSPSQTCTGLKTRPEQGPIQAPRLPQQGSLVMGAEVPGWARLCPACAGHHLASEGWTYAACPASKRRPRPASEPSDDPKAGGGRCGVSQSSCARCSTAPGRQCPQCCPNPALI